MQHRNSRQPSSIRSLRLAALLGFLGLITPGRATAQSPFAHPGEPLDYGLLSHKLAIELLRAGNHDAAGSNQYFFQVKMVGMLNISEERNLSYDKRKKIEVDVGAFGDSALEALSIWKPDEKLKDVKELSIEGNQIRELTARVMTELHAQEPQVCVMVEVTLFEREKKLMFFGEDTLVTKASFYPIPPTVFDDALRTNTTMTMQDDKGLEVRIAVLFDKPASKKKGDLAGDTATVRSTSTSTSVRKSAEKVGASPKG